MMTNTLMYGLILTVVLVSVSQAAEYNYRLSDSTYGPNGWAKTFPNYCAGKRQSPVDIEVKDTKYDESLKDGLKFTRIDEVPSGPTMQIGNNKHSYRVYLKKNHFYVEGEGLPGKFNVFSFHFHWGSDDTKGSEHKIDGRQYPAEMHLVNWNTKYATIMEALNYTDGLAAIAVLLKVGETENKALSAFLEYAVNLTNPKEIYNLTQTKKVSDLLPENYKEFYRYNGSLTTPICQEIVTWTVFKEPKIITEEQLKLLRSLKNSNESSNNALTDTFRPVQPLNGRTVYRSFDLPPTEPPTTAVGCALKGTGLTAILSVIMAVLAMFS